MEDTATNGQVAPVERGNKVNGGAREGTWSKIVRRVKELKKRNVKSRNCAGRFAYSSSDRKMGSGFQNLISGLKNISLTIILQKPFWAFPEELIPL